MLFNSLHVRAVELVIFVKPIGILTHLLISISDIALGREEKTKRKKGKSYKTGYFYCIGSPNQVTLPGRNFDDMMRCTAVLIPC